MEIIRSGLAVFCIVFVFANFEFIEDNYIKHVHESYWAYFKKTAKVVIFSIPVIILFTMILGVAIWGIITGVISSLILWKFKFKK